MHEKRAREDRARGKKNIFNPLAVRFSFDRTKSPFSATEFTAIENCRKRDSSTVVKMRSSGIVLLRRVTRNISTVEFLRFAGKLFILGEKLYGSHIFAAKRVPLLIFAEIKKYTVDFFFFC